MERLTQILTMAVAACFAGAAAYLYGRILAMGHTEIAAYWTFADIVNNAAPVVLKYGPITLLVTYINYRLTISTSYWSILGIALTNIPFLAILFFQPKGVSVVFAAFGLLNLGMFFKQTIIDWIGKTAFLVIEACIWGAATLLLFGFREASTDFYKLGTAVALKEGKLCAPVSLMLDRGIALVANDQLRVIPWGEVQEVGSYDKPESSNIEAWKCPPISPTNSSAPKPGAMAPPAEKK